MTPYPMKIVDVIANVTRGFEQPQNPFVVVEFPVQGGNGVGIGTRVQACQAARQTVDTWAGARTWRDGVCGVRVPFHVVFVRGARLCEFSIGALLAIGAAMDAS